MPHFHLVSASLDAARRASCWEGLAWSPARTAHQLEYLTRARRSAPWQKRIQTRRSTPAVVSPAVVYRPRERISYAMRKFDGVVLEKAYIRTRAADPVNV